MDACSTTTAPPPIGPEGRGPVSDVVEGTVKWFDAGRGFGFVVSDRVEGDVLLHAGTLRAFGQSSLPEGWAVTLRVRRTARGMQAVELIDVAAPAAAGRGAAPRSAAGATPYLPARVKWFDEVRGFGFATAFDREGDIFIHVDVLRWSGFESLETGEAICLRAVDGPRGQFALELRRWDGPDRAAA